MAVLRLDEIARIAGGTILRGSPALSFGSYGIDSRLADPGRVSFSPFPGVGTVTISSPTPRRTEPRARS